jgi:hypothetical protein
MAIYHQNGVFLGNLENTKQSMISGDISSRPDFFRKTREKALHFSIN